MVTLGATPRYSAVPEASTASAVKVALRYQVSGESTPRFCCLSTK